MATYCAPSDLSSTGINSLALTSVPIAEQLAACQQASDTMDSYFRGRYALPLSNFGTDVTFRAVKIAVYLLMTARGFNPSAGADSRIRLDYEDAIAWCEGVQRQAVHPNVVPAVAQPGDGNHDLPQVQTSPQRGWRTFGSNGKPTVGW